MARRGDECEKEKDSADCFGQSGIGDCRRHSGCTGVLYVRGGLCPLSLWRAVQLAGGDAASRDGLDAVLIYFLRSSLKFLQVFLKTGRTTPMLRIPMYYIYSIAPVSAVLMMVSYAVMLVRKFILKTPEKEDEA